MKTHVGLFGPGFVGVESGLGELGAGSELGVGLASVVGLEFVEPAAVQ